MGLWLGLSNIHQNTVQMDTDLQIELMIINICYTFVNDGAGFRVSVWSGIL